MDFYAFQSSELTSNQLTIKEKDLSEVSGNVFIIQFLNLVFLVQIVGFHATVIVTVWVVNFIV